MHRKPHDARENRYVRPRTEEEHPAPALGEDDVMAIVMGSEDKGIRRLTKENCDFVAALPMAGKVECLNVSVATGISLFEAVRQRRKS